MLQKLLCHAQTQATSNTQLADIIYELSWRRQTTMRVHTANTHTHMTSQGAEKPLSCAMLEPESCSKSCTDYMQSCTGCQLPISSNFTFTIIWHHFAPVHLPEFNVSHRINLRQVPRVLLIRDLLMPRQQRLALTWNRALKAWPVVTTQKNARDVSFLVRPVETKIHKFIPF